MLAVDDLLDEYLQYIGVNLFLDAKFTVLDVVVHVLHGTKTHPHVATRARPDVLQRFTT